MCRPSRLFEPSRSGCSSADRENEPERNRWQRHLPVDTRQEHVERNPSATVPGMVEAEAKQTHIRRCGTSLLYSSSVDAANTTKLASPMTMTKGSLEGLSAPAQFGFQRYYRPLKVRGMGDKMPSCVAHSLCGDVPGHF